MVQTVRGMASGFPIHMLLCCFCHVKKVWTFVYWSGIPMVVCITLLFQPWDNQTSGEQMFPVTKCPEFGYLLYQFFCQKLKQSLFVEFITTFLCSKLHNQSHSTIFSIQGFCDEKNFLRIWNISNQISETFWFDFIVVALSYWVSESYQCLVLLSQKAFTLGKNIHFGNWIHSDNACCINYPNLEN